MGGKFGRVFVFATTLSLAAAWCPEALAGANVSQATPQQKSEAQKLFLDAKKAFDARKLDDALKGFRASYDTVSSPNSLLMVARTLRELDRLVEAYTTYNQVIAEADEAAKQDPKYKAAADAAKKELGEVQPRIAFVTLQIKGATADTTITIDGREIPRDQWDKAVPVRAGVVAITAASPGKAPVNEDVTVAGGSSTHVMDLAKVWEPAPSAPPTPPPTKEVTVDDKTILGMEQRTWAYVAGGVGVAGLATFGVFGAMSRSKYNDLESSCPGGICPADRQSDIDAGKRDQTIANIGLIVGVVGLGTGTALYFLDDKSGSGRETATKPSTSVGLGPGSVTVQGSF
jgi:hypothetical protein